MSERSAGTAWLMLLALALGAAALATPWFEYGFSSGRQTAPDAPYNMDGNGVERQHIQFTAFGWNGDVEPTDARLANAATLTAFIGTTATMAAALVVALGEVPRLHRRIHRGVALPILAVGLVAALGAVAATFVLFPASLAGLGVTSPFTARLDEPDGYTRTRLTVGWFVAAVTPFVFTAATLLKYQAGHDALDVVEAHAGREA